MGRGGRGVLVAAVVLLVGGACGSVPAGPAAPGGGGATTVAVRVPCLRTTGAGDPQWDPGAPSARLGAIADRLTVLANAHRDQSTGVAICSDNDRVGIFVLPGPGQARSGALALARANPGLVEVFDVPHSLADQLTAMDRCQALMDGPSPAVVSMGPLLDSGGIRLGIRPSSGTAADIDAQRGPDVSAVRVRLARLVVGVPVRFHAVTSPLVPVSGSHAA